MTASLSDTLTFTQLVERAQRLAARGGRRVLGITGAPGAGKSTLAERLVNALGPETAVLVPMDGFHLADAVLHSLGVHARKGAHDTFDGFGYAALMRRICEQQQRVAAGEDDIIYAPMFRRDLEEPVGSAIPVHPSTPLVVTEGNYLLLDRSPWQQVRELIDEVWFLAPPEEQRLERLIARHERFGRSREEATERSLGSDQRNADLINATAPRADLIVRLREE
ncbi:nucleoside/nucleotide kinase family protein [Microbacterium sp.]|uniref:nucleoside/nucleotide kinase family protein n=1 Tax=Microbacterium sp. TaxID=51671 RepID=UPI002810F8EC|nr:nucleoside/nucleotide kinase family protein [Microbacterium sp.]